MGVTRRPEQSHSAVRKSYPEFSKAAMPKAATKSSDGTKYTNTRCGLTKAASSRNASGRMRSTSVIRAPLSSSGGGQPVSVVATPYSLGILSATAKACSIRSLNEIDVRIRSLPSTRTVHTQTEVGTARRYEPARVFWSVSVVTARTRGGEECCCNDADRYESQIGRHAFPPTRQVYLTS